MKLNIKLWVVFAFVSIIGFSACENKLDLKPTNELETSLALNTPEDFENLLKGAYSYLNWYMNGEFMIRPDIMSDNLIINQNGRQSNGLLYRLKQSSTTATWLNVGERGGVVVYNCNLLLENIEKLRAINEAKAKQYEAEAKALRAMVYFDMARVYCQAPASGSNDSYGMYYKFVNNIRELPARGTLGELYTNIIKDLNEAKDNLSTDAVVGRINKYTAYGLLSRIYLYQGKFAEARDAANEVIQNSSYKVTPRDKFTDLWDDQYTDNMLLKYPVVNSDNFSIGTAFKQNTRAEYVPDFGFYNMYQAADIRKEAYFRTGEFEGGVYNLIIKYELRPGSPADVADIPVLRMEEVYLNYAEAVAEAGQGSASLSALAALDQIRSNRYAGFSSGGETGDALKDAIRTERRLELAFEGHRSFDLKRWGLGFTRSDNGEFADGTGTPPAADYKSLNAGDHRFLWPIPQAWINVNPNFEQNPGYN